MPTPQPDLSVPLVQRNAPSNLALTSEDDTLLMIAELQRAVLTLQNACLNLQERVDILEP